MIAAPNRIFRLAENRLYIGKFLSIITIIIIICFTPFFQTQRFFILLILVAALDSRTKECPKGVRDIAFILEVPQKAAKRAVRNLKEVYATYHKNDTASLRCLHYTAIVVEDQIDIVQKLACQTRACFDAALSEMDRIAERIPNVRKAV